MWGTVVLWTDFAVSAPVAIFGLVIALHIVSVFVLKSMTTIVFDTNEDNEVVDVFTLPAPAALKV